MAKRHYIPITADVPGVNEGQRAFIRKVIRTALAAEGVDFPCEVDVLLTNDEAIHQINLDMREVDRATDVLSFPEFDLQPGELPGGEDADPGTGLVPLGDMVISMEHVAALPQALLLLYRVRHIFFLTRQKENVGDILIGKAYPLFFPCENRKHIAITESPIPSPYRSG